MEHIVLLIYFNLLERNKQNYSSSIALLILYLTLTKILIK